MYNLFSETFRIIIIHPVVQISRETSGSLNMRENLTQNHRQFYKSDSKS